MTVTVLWDIKDSTVVPYGVQQVSRDVLYRIHSPTMPAPPREHVSSNELFHTRPRHQFWQRHQPTVSRHAAIFQATKLVAPPGRSLLSYQLLHTRRDQTSPPSQQRMSIAKKPSMFNIDINIEQTTSMFSSRYWKLHFYCHYFWQNVSIIYFSVA